MCSTFTSFQYIRGGEKWGEERRAHKISFSLPAPVALAQETVGVGAASLKGSEFILVTD